MVYPKSLACVIAALALAATFAEAQQAAAPRVNPNALLAIDQNRTTVVDRIVSNWGNALVQSGAGVTQDQLREILNGLRADHLLAASLAGTSTGLRDVIANALTATAPVKPSLMQAKALGDTSDDLVYTPIVPCRILDTRKGTAPPYNAPMVGGSAFPVAASLSNFSSQGGSATSCNLPASFQAIVVTFTVLNPNFDAYLAAGNSNNYATLIQAIVMDFSANKGLANTATVPVDGTVKFYLAMPAQVTTNVIADVAGYFKPAVNATTGAFEVAVNGNLALRITPPGDLQVATPNIIGGGKLNSVAAAVSGATIAGGGDVVFGANANTVGANFGTVGGGYGNTAGLAAGIDVASTIAGGIGNTAAGFISTVGGGYHNIATGSGSTVGGGDENTATGPAEGAFSTVAGGSNNASTGPHSTIGGGGGNTASGAWSTVAGGGTNTASGDLFNTVGGGDSNQATLHWDTVAGGSHNAASGGTSVVAGGSRNTASGNVSTVAGGDSNTASGALSFAAGFRAKTQTAGASPTVHGGTFVWADFSDFDFNSTAGNEFSVRATGGVRFVTAIDGTTGAPTWTCGVSGGSGGSWGCSSDRNLKTGLVSLDGVATLERLAALPVYRWFAKDDARRIPHAGPMAQDFMAAFGLGDNDKMIGFADAQGVAFAAIQGLHKLLQDKDQELTVVKRKLEAIEAKLGLR